MKHTILSMSFINKFKEPHVVRRVMGRVLRMVSPLIKDDATYLRWSYRLNMGKKLDLDNPKTFNEKLQWLKINCRRPQLGELVDKYKVKDTVAAMIGKQYLIPTLGVWDRAEDIDFDALPDSFVLKCTHDSGSVVICRDKSVIDRTKIVRQLDKALRTSYYMQYREYPYLYVSPRIIAEPLMTDVRQPILIDYKFFCFDGDVKFMFVATDRPVDTRFDFFDADFNHIPVRQGHPNATKPVERPVKFDEMKCLAAKLSKGHPHVRIDFYEINGQVYFGEFTFFHFSGNVPFEPDELDYRAGEWLRLPIV